MRLLYLTLLFPFMLYAQAPPPGGLVPDKGWQALTISDGLSQGMIYDLKQDRTGFIWIATKDGLNRYDGHNFKVFTHDPYNTFSVSGNTCSALLIDSHRRLWVGTLNEGLNLYDDGTQRFYHLNITDRQSPNAGNYEIRMLAEDPEGNIWAGTSRNKLFKITLSATLKTKFPQQANLNALVRLYPVSFPLPGASSSSAPSRVEFQKNGQAIVSAAGGMFAVNWRNPAAVHQLYEFGLEASPFRATPLDTHPDYWFGYRPNGLTGWREGKPKQIKLPTGTFYNICLTTLDTNTIAVATPDFLWLMTPAQLYAQDSLSARNAFAVMPRNLYGITRLLKDYTGSIWIGTAGYGVRVFNPRIKQFKAFLPNTSLTFLFQDRQGKIYVRDQFRYRRFDRSKNQLQPFLNKSEGDVAQSQSYLMQDSHGFFWLSVPHFDAHTYQLIKFSENWQRLRTYSFPPNTALGSYGNQTIEDKMGQLWIGAINGKLLRFDPVRETFQVFSYQPLLPQLGAEIETYHLYFDQAQTLWISTQKGLVRAAHPFSKPLFTLYKNAQTNRQSLSNDFVSCMVDDPYQPNQYLWVSTKGGGLERLDKQTGRFTHFTETQGLPNPVVYGMLPDASKNLWLSTNRGLAQFSPKTGKFRNYTKTDGLQDDEFNTGSFFKTPSGELLFGGINGLTAFHPSDVMGKNTPLAQVHIVGLKINNEPVRVGNPKGVLTATIENTPQLDLAYQQNLLTFEFALMDYTNPAQNQYRYQLKGIDPDWVQAGTNRFANYAQLPDGHYQFQLMGSTDGETWSQPVELLIHIHPPFYRTWWAFLVYFTVVAFIGWQLYRFQTQRLLLQQQLVFEHKEASRLAELDALKTQFFTNISHEFRTPLTMILGPLNELKQRYKAESMLPLMERNANRLLNLINQLLDLSKLEAGQLNVVAEPGDIVSFLRILASSFSSLAESRLIDFYFGQNQTECWTDFDRDKLEKIVTNLLSNAFKFTPNGGQIRMLVTYTDSDSVTLTIQDTGIGIAPAYLPHIFERFYQVEGQLNRPYEGTGIGLALVYELVTVLGGTIDVASTEGTGTTFTVTLPLVGASEKADASTPNPLKEASDPAGLTPFTGLGVFEPAASTIDWSPAPPTPPSENILLIIDDNADIRAYIRSVFEADYQVLEASDGQAGLEQATATTPDIIICDLMMPRLDGFGFCRALKSQEATSHIPVVMLTAKATVEDRIEGFELGADDYLTKPFNRAEIRARVRNLVQQRQRLYQHFATTNFIPVPAVAPTEPLALVTEQKFVDRLRAIVMEHIDQPNFRVDALAEGVNMSRSQLHRKLKAIANTSATDFIRSIRLARAAELLRSGEESVTQVAFAVGFDNLSYFAKVFQEQYGMLPSHYGQTTDKPSTTP